MMDKGIPGRYGASHLRHKSTVDDLLCFFPIGIHNVRYAGNICRFGGQRHQVVTTDRREAEVPAACHQLLQADLELVGKGL